MVGKIRKVIEMNSSILIGSFSVNVEIQEDHMLAKEHTNGSRILITFLKWITREIKSFTKASLKYSKSQVVKAKLKEMYTGLLLILILL